MTNHAVINNIKFNGHRIQFFVNGKGQLCCRLYKTITSGKFAGSPKILYSYYFSSEKLRMDWATKQFNEIKMDAAAAEIKKARVADLRKNLVVPYQVGHIFYDSWGYDQTNINFYQVIEVKNKSVIMREIAKVIVEGSQGNMCEHVKPEANDFVGKEFMRPIIISIANDNPNYHVNGFRGCLFNYEYGEKGVYQSHYA